MNDTHALVPVKTPEQDSIIVNSWLRAKRSPHTQLAYTRDIAAFYAFVGKPLQHVTLPDLLDYAESLTSPDKHLEPSTQARMLAAVKSLLTFAHKLGYTTFNIGGSLQLPQGKDKLAQRILSPAQVQRMLYVAEKSGNARNHVIILLLYASGIRCAELCNLQWIDVQETADGGQITVIGKRQKTRSIALHKIAWQALQSFKPAGVPLEEYVFTSRQAAKRKEGKPRDHRLSEVQVWRIVTQIAHEAGVKASTHWLRHAHATRAMERGIPLKVIQETLGHADLRTPSKYQHVRPNV